MFRLTKYLHNIMWLGYSQPAMYRRRAYYLTILFFVCQRRNMNWNLAETLSVKESLIIIAIISVPEDLKIGKISPIPTVLKNKIQEISIRINHFPYGCIRIIFKKKCSRNTEHSQLSSHKCVFENRYLFLVIYYLRVIRVSAPLDMLCAFRFRRDVPRPSLRPNWLTRKYLGFGVIFSGVD